MRCQRTFTYECLKCHVSKKMSRKYPETHTILFELQPDCRQRGRCFIYIFTSADNFFTWLSKITGHFRKFYTQDLKEQSLYGFPSRSCIPAGSICQRSDPKDHGQELFYIRLFHKYICSSGTSIICSQLLLIICFSKDEDKPSYRFAVVPWASYDLDHIQACFYTQALTVEGKKVVSNPNNGKLAICQLRDPRISFCII